MAFLSITAIVRAEETASPPRPEFDARKLAAIPDRMKQLIEQHEIAGAVTLVATRDKVVHLEAVGQANVAGNEPMRVDSIFWIASMTKPVTATAVLMLQDEGKLSVDDPVAKYLPEFAELKTPSGKPANLTLRHLLTHTSGMDNADAETKNATTLAELIPEYVKKTTHFEPGSKWEYCQSAINTLGRIIEVVSGEPYDRFVQKRVLDPLGMKDTSFYPTTEQLPRIARSYKRVGDNLEESPIAFLQGKDPSSHDRAPRPNGGLFSTAADYGRFCQMLLNGGTFEGKTYLKPETFKLMTTIQTGDIHTGFTEGNGWGLGVCVVRQPQGVSAMLSPGTFGHGGAYGTQAWVDPVKGVAYVLMVQRANFANSDDSPVRKAFQEAAAGAVN
jgi:CubicO group peptidase (beta-lactamase class C family)